MMKMAFALMTLSLVVSISAFAEQQTTNVRITKMSKSDFLGLMTEQADFIRAELASDNPDYDKVMRYKKAYEANAAANSDLLAAEEVRAVRLRDTDPEEYGKRTRVLPRVLRAELGLRYDFEKNDDSTPAYWQVTQNLPISPAHDMALEKQGKGNERTAGTAALVYGIRQRRAAAGEAPEGLGREYTQVTQEWGKLVETNPEATLRLHTLNQNMRLVSPALVKNLFGSFKSIVGGVKDVDLDDAASMMVERVGVGILQSTSATTRTQVARRARTATTALSIMVENGIRAQNATELDDITAKVTDIATGFNSDATLETLLGQDDIKPEQVGPIRKALLTKAISIKFPGRVSKSALDTAYRIITDALPRNADSVWRAEMDSRGLAVGASEN